MSDIRIKLLPILAAILWTGTAQAESTVSLVDEIPVPAGTIAFFNGIDDTCPSGFSAPRSAAGRLIVGVAVGNEVGGTVNQALDNGENRKHKHDYSFTVDIKSKGITASSSCCNRSGAKKDNLDIAERITDDSSSGLPFLQLIVCERSSL